MNINPTDFDFITPGPLIDGDLTLVLIVAERDRVCEEPVPTYRFAMALAGSDQQIGFINLRIGSSDNLTRYRGHIGYGVDPHFRGNRYAARACRLLLPLAAHHHQNPIWITCNPDNAASRVTCERAGAEFVEIVNVPEGTEAYRAGARIKCRYRIWLQFP